MNYKTLLLSLLTLIPSAIWAGGYLTNTNQHIAWLRMMARGTSHEIDAIYSNPAGLSWLEHEGWSLSLNVQNVAQHRDINAKYQIFDYSAMKAGLTTAPSTQAFSHKYVGKATAPIVPSVFAAYKKGPYVLSGSISVVGGGGKASYDDGLPMFSSAIHAGMANTDALGQLKQALGAAHVSDMYDINSAMEGRQYIYGGQLGLTYKINDYLSVFGGGRMNFFTGGYKGYVDAVIKEPYATVYRQVANKQDNHLKRLSLDCDQSGWGITPILGLSAKYKKFTLGMKYEFLTNLNIENDTHKNSDPNGALADFKNGVNTPSDIPALLTAAVGCDFLPCLRATAEYHHFFDKQAGMAHNKQKKLTGGTNEYLLGVEWDVDKRLTLSAGGQITDYGLADGFQSDTSFSCDSYSIGFGAAFRLNAKAKLNIGYFWTTYKDYDKAYTSFSGNLPMVQGDNVYSRSNKVFGVGLDYAL